VLGQSPDTNSALTLVDDARVYDKAGDELAWLCNKNDAGWNVLLLTVSENTNDTYR
jgi:hypothetical protein